MNSILMKDWTRLFDDERQVIDLIDSRAKLNLINYVYVVQWKLQLTFAILLTLNFLNNNNRYYYDVYKLIYYLIDSWDQHRECTILFYLIKYISSNLILDMSMLVKQNILIDLKIKS